MAGILGQYQDGLLLSLKGIEAFRMLPEAADREAWDAIGVEAAAELIRRADRWLTVPIPGLTLDHYWPHDAAGGQHAFFKAYEARRESLRTLVLATCAQPSDRYLMEIARLIWAICEESSWSAPAHYRSDEFDALPDVRAPLVDQYAARTAIDLIATAQMIGPSLDALSPRLRARIEYEVMRRVAAPFHALEHMDWMLGAPEHALECLSGCMMAFLTYETDDRTRWRSMRKAWRLLDEFVENLSPDGGVMGGLTRWMEITGALIDCLLMVYYATDGEIDPLSEPLIQSLTRFPAASHLGGGWFVNPGERTMRPFEGGLELFRVGMAARDAYLCDLGAYLHKTGGAGAEAPEGATLLRRTFETLYRPVVDLEPVNPPLLLQTILPETQFFMARVEHGSAQGMTLALMGGDNGAPGCHLDTGDIALFAGGEPILIDLSNLPDTRAHNLPTVEGIGQRAGAKYAARDITWRLEDSYALAGLDIAPAYPPEAGILNWQRTAILDRESGAQLIDVFDLDRPACVQFHFIAAQKPELGSAHARVGSVRVQWDAQLEPSVQPIELTGTAAALWGETAYRLTLSTPGAVNGGTYAILFREIRTFGI